MSHRTAKKPKTRTPFNIAWDNRHDINSDTLHKLKVASLGFQLRVNCDDFEFGIDEEQQSAEDDRIHISAVDTFIKDTTCPECKSGDTRLAAARASLANWTGNEWDLSDTRKPFECKEGHHWWPNDQVCLSAVDLHRVEAMTDFERERRFWGQSFAAAFKFINEKVTENRLVSLAKKCAELKQHMVAVQVAALRAKDQKFDVVAFYDAQPKLSPADAAALVAQSVLNKEADDEQERRHEFDLKKKERKAAAAAIAATATAAAAAPAAGQL